MSSRRVGAQPGPNEGLLCPSIPSPFVLELPHSPLSRTQGIHALSGTLTSVAFDPCITSQRFLLLFQAETTREFLHSHVRSQAEGKWLIAELIALSIDNITEVPLLLQPKLVKTPLVAPRLGPAGAYANRWPLEQLDHLRRAAQIPWRV